MREAVMVSYARTGLAKSVRGGFNMTPPMTMAAHAIKHAVDMPKTTAGASVNRFCSSGLQTIAMAANHS